MSWPDERVWTEWQQIMIGAMRDELDWAPMRFQGWAAYEKARPLMAGETYQIIGDHRNQGYVLQYRPLLGELVECWHTPVDTIPDVTVLGQIDESQLTELHRLSHSTDPHELSEQAAWFAQGRRRLPIEPAIQTGGQIPAQAEIPIHYLPAGDEPWLPAGQLISQDHPAVAYAVAGHWQLRLGAPVGLTPTGRLVFHPPGFNNGERLAGIRLTIEHPTTASAWSVLHEARTSIYRHDGAGGWEQTAVMYARRELSALCGPQRLDSEVMRPIPRQVVPAALVGASLHPPDRKPGTRCTPGS